MISGIDVRNPTSNTLHRVDRAGDLRAVWRNAIHWVTVAWGVLGTAARAVFCMTCDACVALYLVYRRNGCRWEVYSPKWR